MATKTASGHQGEVKDPEHDGRLKRHKGAWTPGAGWGRRWEPGPAGPASVV